jgi:plastocyanin
MKVRRMAVVATFLPALAALCWPAVTGPPASAATRDTGETTCTADGTALEIVAEDNKFDKDCMAVPADQAFTIELDNQDWGLPHNVSIYDTANGNTTLYKGEIIYGPSKVTYTVPAQAKGTYEFICDPHAEFMRGTFIVG